MQNKKNSIDVFYIVFPYGIDKINTEIAKI